MDCRQTRNLLENDARDPAASGHVRDCADCRALAEDLRLVQGLRQLPAREPAADFEQRVLEAALARFPEPRSSSNTLAWGLAMAASLALAAVVSLRLFLPESAAPTQLAGNEQAAQVFTVTARPAETRIVDVVLDSKHALENATLIVSMDDNLMLENRPDMRELRWQTNVKAGGNKLSLPVQLRNSTGGEMTVTLEHGDIRQQVRILVREAAPAAASQSSI